MTDDLGAVTVNILPTTGVALRVAQDLGAVAMTATQVVIPALPQPGTLANPYAAADTDSRALGFTSAMFVASEPPALTGPSSAPSIWYEFTESQVGDLLAIATSFAHATTIELWSGPAGATTDDLTFVATDGVAAVNLGAVTLSALVTTAVASLRVLRVDLGAVALDETLSTSVALS